MYVPSVVLACIDRYLKYLFLYPLSLSVLFHDNYIIIIIVGTWFITELCRTLCKFATVWELDEIQKEVNERVVKNYKYDTVGYKQQPRGIDQLRRKVFFFQKDI